MLRERTLFDVRLHGDDDVTGRGEAAPLEPYDGVSDEDVRAALDAYASRPAALGPEAGGVTVLDACRAAADLPQALAAIDLALWDRAGRHSGRPVAELLADDPLDAVPVNATVDAPDRATARPTAPRPRGAGFSCVKLKVGVGDDAGRVAAARAAAGPSMALRLDANGAWESRRRSHDRGARPRRARARRGAGPRHARAARGARPRAGPHRDGRDRRRAGRARVGRRRRGVPEGRPPRRDLRAPRAAALAQATGAEVYLASTFDGPLGIAAAVHCAAALRVQAPCGLATLELFEGLDDVLPVRDGRMALPDAPGLGVS